MVDGATDILPYWFKLIFLLELIAIPYFTTAQQFPLSQYYVSPINLNPALAGSSTQPLIIAQHRSQWNTSANSYPVSIASAIYPISQLYSPRVQTGGLGAALIRESTGMQGWLTHTEIQLAGAYNLPLDFRQKHVISLGISTSYLQRNLNVDNIRWGSQYDATAGYNPGIDPSVRLIRDRRGYMSAEAGIVWSYNSFKNILMSPWQWMSGLTISNMNRPDISFTDQAQSLPIAFTWHGGASYSKYYWKIHPQAMVMWQGANYHLNVGAYGQYQIRKTRPNQANTILIGGLWYRWGDAIAVSGGVLHQNLQFSLSADFARSPSPGYRSAGAAWEAAIVFTVPSKKSTHHRRSTPLI
ncbi:MAG: PorP/SprF family type IX secretion system membrane protein [Bacteroidota bacterium]